MKIKAKIFQIIKWEEKDDYIYNTDFGNIPVDLLYVECVDNETPKWYQRGKIGFFRSYLISNKNPPFKYRNFIFHSKIPSEKYPNYEGLMILAERPNTFKEGDIIEIDYTIKKTENGGDI